MTGPARPVLRWHGGKWKLAPWVIENLPPHRIYVEPFGGAASVLMRKERSYAEVYNDLDANVVNLFRVLRDPVRAAALTEMLRLTPFAREEHETAYTDTSDELERARQLIVLAFMGFGSNGHNRRRKTGFRSNSNRSGTTPAHDWVSYPHCIPAFVERLRGVVIESRPAIDVMRQHDSDETLHYVDPPYLPETRSGLMHSSECYAHEMTTEEHVSLLAALKELRGMVVLSGYPAPLYDDALSSWTRIERKALADGARDRVEVLWLNPEASDSVEAARCQIEMFSSGRSPEPKQEALFGEARA